MKYRSLVHSNSNFQTSVNLQFDINKENKIDHYIPTSQGVAILKRYLNAVYHDSFQEDNATVLIGPYGRGKSHLLLVLSALIRGRNDMIKVECLERLVKKLDTVDSEAAELAEALLHRNKPLLTVILNSNHADIKQTFILGLREALERECLTDFFPKTYFDSALAMIDTWESSYEDALKTFKKQLKVKRTSLKEMRLSLGQCDRKAYELFCEIYPNVTSGAEFNPMQNADVVKMYSQVAQALAEQKQFGGLFIVFDEFSKFLESNAAMTDMQNLKIIQDFAELAVRNKLIHLCCVTHKDILDYSQSDSFRTVDGRFKKVYFVASAEQSYELVANALEHTEKFEQFWMKHQTSIQLVNQAVYRTGIFEELGEDEFEKIIMKGCFPLHPFTVYSLIRISEMVGQNERTLFTFLSESEEHTLQAFLQQDFDKESISLLTPDVIFDYFADLFRMEVFQPKIHSIWAKANAALKQATDCTQQKLIKTIAIMLIISEDKFVPVSVVLKTAVHMSDHEFSAAMNSLLQNHILIERSNSHLAFLTPNGVDIRKTIQNQIEQGLVRLDRSEVLQSVYSISYILPRQYNAEKSMMRYFRTAFMEATDFQNYTGDFHELRENADGLVLYLIASQQEEIYLVGEKIQNLHLPENILVCVTENWTDDSLLTEYTAACMLGSDKRANDSHFAEELKLYHDDLFKTIQEKTNQIYSPLNANVVYYSANGCLDHIVNPLLLNREISSICSRYYSDTPIINNELVNKNHLTAQIRKARVKLIDWLLSHPDEIPMMDGYGPEVSLLRSAICVKGLHKSSETEDQGLQKCLDVIKSHVCKAAQEPVDFSKIYAELTATPFGMRMGVIPIYLSYVLRQYRETLILYYNDQEIEVSGAIFDNIEREPAAYTFRIESKSIEREQYLNAIFAAFSNSKELNSSVNRQSALSAMQEWFRSLPKYVRTCMYEYREERTDVSDEIIAFRKKLNLYDLNPHQFLFDFLPDLFKENDLLKLAEYLQAYKIQADSSILHLKRYLTGEVNERLSVNIEGGLCSRFYEWYHSLTDRTKKNVFDSDTNALLKIVSANSSFDDMELITNLAKEIESIRIEDWNDDMVTTFLNDIQHIIENVERFDLHSEGMIDTGVSITLNYGEQVYEKNISDTEISGLAETVLNNIETTLEDYGDAVSAQEKIAVLLKILKKEIDQM